MTTTLSNEPATPNPVTQPHRRTGKVARLPKSVRDKINHALADGVPYAQIIASLGPHGAGLSEQNISRWKDGGHQDWLNDQAWRDELRLRGEAFSELLGAKDDSVQLPEAGLRVAVTGVCELLRSLTHPGPEPDAAKIVAVSNVLARLSRSILQLQQYRDEIAKTKEEERKRREGDESAQPSESVQPAESVPSTESVPSSIAAKPASPASFLAPPNPLTATQTPTTELATIPIPAPSSPAIPKPPIDHTHCPRCKNNVGHRLPWGQRLLNRCDRCGHDIADL